MSIQSLKRHTKDHLIACIADFFGNQEWEFDHETKADILSWIEDCCTEEEIEAFTEYA